MTLNRKLKTIEMTKTVVAHEQPLEHENEVHAFQISAEFRFHKYVRIQKYG